MISNGAGLGLMAADQVEESGLAWAEPGESTLSGLKQSMPDHWAYSNPVDLQGDADQERYRQAASLLLSDSGVDGLLALLAPLGITDEAACARGLAQAAAESRKPVLACWAGESQVEEGRELLTEAGVSHYLSPEEGVEAFSMLAAYQRAQKALLQAPPPLSGYEEADLGEARRIIEQADLERRAALNSAEALALLQAFHIPVVPSIAASTVEETVAAAESVGFPVVLKINSGDVVSRTTLGGVRLGIQDAHSVGRAFEGMMAQVGALAPGMRLDGVLVEPVMDRPGARNSGWPSTMTPPSDP